MRLTDMPDFPDSDEVVQDDYDVGDEDNVAGFIELFYLWCVTYRDDRASLSGFGLSSTRLVALGERDSRDHMSTQNPLDK
jgi:hypothetical protein